MPNEGTEGIIRPARTTFGCSHWTLPHRLQDSLKCRIVLASLNEAIQFVVKDPLETLQRIRIDALTFFCP